MPTRVLEVATLGFLTTVAVEEALAGPDGWQARTIAELAVAVGMGAMIQVGVVRPLQSRLTTERTRRAAAQAEVRELRDLHRFATRFESAIVMADSEPEVLALAGRALTQLLPQRDNALLLAPPTEPRITWVIPSLPDGLGEPTATGQGQRCSALGSRRTVSFASSGELDACPHLAANDLDVSSICVPLLVDGTHLGVLHSAGAEGDLPNPLVVDTMSRMAAVAAARIALLRQQRVETDAVVLDALTGLPNQTVVNRRMRELLGEGRPFSVALCDVDAFAAYNLEHGNELGDIALRLYAEVIGATLRPDDVIARYGGDKFLCVFPNCAAEHARAAMERVRESLVLELATHGFPPFSVSVGICHSSQSDQVEALVEIGDVALAVAKNLGGNRVCLDDFALDPALDDGD